jgi:hypothetical protein
VEVWAFRVTGLGETLFATRFTDGFTSLHLLAYLDTDVGDMAVEGVDTGRGHDFDKVTESFGVC